MNDSSDQRELMQFIFQQAEYRVLVASSGREGFKLAKSSRLDLIVSDVMMSDGDGIELCQWIRADEKLRNLPILLVSGLRKDVNHVVEGLEVGADDYIELPVDPLRLVSRAERLIERNRMAELLRESEAKFRKVLENSRDLIYQFNLKTKKFDYLSPAVLELSGYSAEEFVEGGFSFSNSLVHPEDLILIEKRVKEALSAENTSNMQQAIEYRLKTKDRGYRWISENRALVRDENDAPTAFIATARDITEQRRVETELRRSEANLSDAQRLTHLGSWEVELTDLWRINNNKVRWSDEVYRIFGYQPGEVEVSINKYFDSIHADDRKYCRKAFVEVTTGEKDLNIEFRVCLPTGGERILHGLAELIYDRETGAPQKLIGTVQDITERKLAEQVLESSEARLRKQSKILTELTRRHTLFHSSLEAAIGEIAEITARTLDTARVGIWLYADNKSKIKAVDLYEAKSNHHSQGLELNETDYPFYFKSLAENLIIAASDARADPRLSEFTDSYLVPFGITSMLDVPIQLGGQIVGVICHEHVGAKREWKLDEQNFAASMADLISLLLESNERRQAEEALRRSQRQYESLVHSIDGIVWEMEARTLRLTFISKQAEKLLGYPAEQLMSDPNFWLTCLHEDDHSRVCDLLAEIIEKKQEAEFDYRMIAADGRVAWMRNKITVDVIEGEAKFLRGVTIDITDRKHAEEALKQSERDYRTVFEQAHDAIIIFAPEREIVLDVNRRACELYGFSRAEFIGMSIKTISANIEVGAKRVQETLDAGENHNFETIQYRKDGSEMFLEVNASTIIYQGQQAIITINRDITERKRAEKAISFQAHLLDTVEQSVIATDLDGIVIYWNQFAQKLYGWTAEETAGRSIMAFTTPEFVHEEAVEIMSQLRQGKSWAGELTVRNKTGETFPAQILNSPVFDDKENIVGIVGISADISERRRIEREKEQLNAQIESQRQRLDTIIANVPGIVWETHFSSELTQQVNFVSEYVETLTGYSVEEWMETPDFWFQLIHPDDRDAVKQDTQEFSSNSESVAKQQRWIRKDGEIIWVETRMIVLLDETGKSFGVRGVTIDITERKEAETAIAEANKRAIREYERLMERLAELAESLGTARDLQTIYRALYSFAAVSVPCTGFFISLYDAERNVRLPGYATVDGEEIDISNLPPMEMSGSPNSRAISSGAVVIEDDFQAAMADKPIVHIGMDQNPDLPQSCLVAPMSVMGRIVGGIEAQSNVLAAYTKEHATAMRMAANLAANAIENVRLLEQERAREEQLRLSQKLESVGLLAGGIAHDFNNMLTAINGYSELTLRRLSKDDPLRRNIEEIKKAGERSAALTHQLLAFSRKQVLQSRVLDLNETITDTAQMLKRLIGEDIRLDTVLSPQLGRVEADPGQISQVLTNLAVNARDAMPEGGKLTIETANIFLDSEYVSQHVPLKSGSYVMLAVTDNGIGIDIETQQHIFEPFFTTKEIGKGTGLGLATVYGIVKQSGGYIWVYSEVEHGTTFKIYLPRIDDEVALEAVTGEAESAPKGAETILIVEDEDIVRALTRRILEESGYQVIEASNGVEALSIVERRDYKIDLLLTDVVMPEMGGRELAEKLALIQPNLRVLFTSGYTDDAVIRHNVIETDTNFIQKPFAFDTLAHKVRECLDAEN